MQKTVLFSPYTALVVVVAIVVVAIVSTRPGDHTTLYTVVAGFVGLFVKNAYDASQAAEGRQQTQEKATEAAQAAVKATDAASEAAQVARVAATASDVAAQKAEETAQQLALVDGKIVEVGKQIDGRLTQLLEASKLAEFRRGHDEGRKEESREGMLRATPMPAVPDVTPPIPINPDSAPTATNPLLTEEKAKEIMNNQTVTADKGEGWGNREPHSNEEKKP